MDDFKPESREIKTLYKYDTEYNADSVEWCPHEGFCNVFVCGTYQLKENTENSGKSHERLGRILLFETDENEGLKLMQELETAAILDQKWCHYPVKNRLVLGVVNANKTLEIYRLETTPLELKLIASYTFQQDGTTNKDHLLLSLDWSTGKYASDQPEIVVSDSLGQIHVFSFINDQIVVKKTWISHDYEAWIAAFYYWNSNIMFSGGDDSLLIKYDRRIGEGSLVAKNRSHEAGVTSVHSNREQEFIIASGSYDSNIRLWDLRNFKRPLGQIPTPGPVWRLKWDPYRQIHILAACMLGGVHIIDSKSLQIVDSYYEHQNICYGADWAHLPQSRPMLIGTCSFYDHLLCVSALKLN